MMKRGRRVGKGNGTPDREFARREGKVALAVPGGLDMNEIVELMGRVNHPVRVDDLLRFLDLSRRERKVLESALEMLETEGRILRLRGGRWIAAEQAALVTGTLSVQRSGAGFVTPDSPDRGTRRGRESAPSDIFIRAGLFGDAWHGDRVEVVLQPGSSSRRGKGVRHAARGPEGRIVRVLERRLREVPAYATRRVTGRGVLCRPADPRLEFVLDTDLSSLPETPAPGELLLVKPGEKIGAGVWSGEALSSLGREDDTFVQERLTKLNHQIPLEFPPNVLAAVHELEGLEDLDGLPPLDTQGAAPVPELLPLVSTNRRQDLRGVPFVTIDGADARDFDDAVYAAPVRNRGPVAWELWVAIADVSRFVRTGSVLDREARERGNSCYFPSSVEPMLPEVLSNGLCSLRPGEDRLVMAARIGFDERGEPRTAAFFPGLIRSRARLVYEEVQAAFDAASAGEASYPGGAKAGLPEWLPGARVLAELLLRRRQERGSLDFDLPEARFIVDPSEGRVTNIVRRERLFAHRLIEEFMLAANEAVARFLTEKGVPFPCRVHPAPDPDRLQALFRTLAATGLVSPARLAEWSPRGGAPDPKALRGILTEARGTPREYLVGRLVLRSMMQARYSPDAGEHFGLASPCYCHFTSPIRRYADLLVHRALRHALGEDQPVVSGGKLLAFADQCNARERAATEAEREIARRFGCLLLRDRVGEVFPGIISGVSEFGFFVELDAMPVEGMVRLETIRDDWFEYDPDRQELIGVGTGRRFRLGQRTTVRLADVHVGRLEINLEPMETTGTEKRSRPRRSAGARAERGGPSGRGRSGSSPRRKRR